MADDEDITTEAQAAYDPYVAGMKVCCLSFIFQTRSAYESALTSSGFIVDEIRDHTAYSAQEAVNDLSILSGDNLQ